MEDGRLKMENTRLKIEEYPKPKCMDDGRLKIEDGR